MPQSRHAPAPQRRQVTTVEYLIRELQAHDPKAVVIWNGNFSCVAHAIDPHTQAVHVKRINEDLYSMIGGDRDIPAVIIDVLDPP